MPVTCRIIALALVFLLAACDEGPTSNTRYVHAGGAKQFLIEATKNGDAVPIALHGSVFGDPASLFADAVVSTMTDGLKSRQIRFSAAETGATGFRIVVVFGKVQSLDAKKLCGAAEPRAENAGSERVEVLASFCQGETLLSAVDGLATESKTLDDERPRQMLRQVAQGLFVDNQDRR